MTDIRAQRTAVLAAAAKAKSEAKVKAADQDIRALAVSWPSPGSFSWPPSIITALEADTDQPQEAADVS